MSQKRKTKGEGMIQLKITMTGKGFSPKDKFRIFGEETKEFLNMVDVRKWLKKQYGKSKKGSIYIDTVLGKSQKVGYCYGFRNEDTSHTPVKKWIQQDWVHFYLVNDLDLDLN